MIFDSHNRTVDHTISFFALPVEGALHDAPALQHPSFGGETGIRRAASSNGLACRLLLEWGWRTETGAMCAADVAVIPCGCMVAEEVLGRRLMAEGDGLESVLLRRGHQHQHRHGSNG